MQIYLEYMGYSVDLPHGDIVIGRDVSCSLRFNDPNVSRTHAKISRRGNQVFIEDLGSTNGSWLNGKVVEQRTQMTDGDVLEVGDRMLQVKVLDDEAQALDTSKRARLADLGKLSAPAPAPQRNAAGRRLCPRCGARIDSGSRACSLCKYRWGSFRPTIPIVDADRRREARHPIELHLVYASAELEIEVTSRDLSANGVFVCSHLLDPVGTRCTLTILMEGGPPLRVQGVVRRVIEREVASGEPVGLGIEFVDVGEVERQWLSFAIIQTRRTAAISRVEPE